jgi:carbonic anhydrase
MQKVLKVTQEQYDNIKEMLKGEENNRPVQEGNARTVYLVN